MSVPLTTANLPRIAVKADMCLQEKNDFIYLPDAPVIAGKTIVVNAVGKMYLYMADDHRREVPERIIVHDFCGNLHFLPISHKIAIELKNYN